MADADHSICTFEGCNRPLLQKGYCKTHYSRWWKTGTASRPCPGCGKELEGAGRKYCSVECKPRCTYEGCGRVVSHTGLCKMHVSRLEKHGTVELLSAECVTCHKKVAIKSRQHNMRYCSPECRPSCSLPECSRPVQSRGYCKNHAKRDRMYGHPLKTKGVAWSTEWVCLTCGAEVERLSGKRKFCGSNCQALWHRHGGKVPSSINCTRCGTEFDLWARSALGTKRRSDSKLCDGCKKVDARIWRRALPALIERDKSVCQLCKEPVDVSLKWPHKESASVDHITPRALGGSDDLDNLQLAHLSCNCIKQDRVDFKIA